MYATGFAMRRPVTTLMLVVALVSCGVLSYSRMRVDIFASLNVPKIYVFLDYIGMSPDQIEGFIVNQLELYFQYVDGIQDIKSRNIQQLALCELSFFPGTDMGQAVAQVVAMSDRAMAWMPTRGVVDPQILLESTNQWKSTVAARDAAKATIEKSQAEVFSRDAALEQARVDVTVAEADLSVAESEAKYAKAWVGYLTLTAPYDGVIVARNANTGDFVIPMLGDPTAMQRAPHLAPGGTAAPTYVVDRTDVVRIFVDIPEEDANYVDVGAKASVLVRAYRDQPISGTVTRTAWALNVKSRTLRAEIDLTNPEGRLLPGMYAYADVIVERLGVRALPVRALTHRGDKAYYWRYENGKALRTEVQTGVSDGQWIEVTNRRSPDSTSAHSGTPSWSRIDGSEQVILGDLSILTEGVPVRVPREASLTSLAQAEPAGSP